MSDYSAIRACIAAGGSIGTGWQAQANRGLDGLISELTTLRAQVAECADHYEFEAMEKLIAAARSQERERILEAAERIQFSLDDDYKVMILEDLRRAVEEKP